LGAFDGNWDHDSSQIATFISVEVGTRSADQRKASKVGISQGNCGRNAGDTSDVHGNTEDVIREDEVRSFEALGSEASGKTGLQFVSSQTLDAVADGVGSVNEPTVVTRVHNIVGVSVRRA